MTIDDKIIRYKQKSRKKNPALSSGKIDKYEYFTGKKILPSNKRQLIEQAKFAYPPLAKAFEKERKTIEDQGINQIEAIKPEENQELELIEVLFSQNMGTSEIKK